MMYVPKTADKIVDEVKVSSISNYMNHGYINPTSFTGNDRWSFSTLNDT